MFSIPRSPEMVLHPPHCATEPRPSPPTLEAMAIDAVGRRFRWALRHRGVSAAELGRHLGVTRSAVSQWWATKNPTSPRAKIGQISELLNLSADWLLTGRGEPLHENCGSAP
jgi:hypothetical protein